MKQLEGSSLLDDWFLIVVYWLIAKSDHLGLSLAVLSQNGHKLRD
jgi:hypothetical protein